MTAPLRRVVIVRDPASGGWVVRCAVPCARDGWCMGRDLVPGDSACSLGHGEMAFDAAVLATALQYEVAE